MSATFANALSPGRCSGTDSTPILALIARSGCSSCRAGSGSCPACARALPNIIALPWNSVGAARFAAFGSAGPPGMNSSRSVGCGGPIARRHAPVAAPRSRRAHPSCSGRATLRPRDARNAVRRLVLPNTCPFCNAFSSIACHAAAEVLHLHVRLHAERQTCVDPSSATSTCASLPVLGSIITRGSVPNFGRNFSASE
jgi:hypothetical protein